MWQCPSHAPGGGVYFGLTGLGSGGGRTLIVASAIVVRHRNLVLRGVK
jgi:hypothetical protein